MIFLARLDDASEKESDKKARQEMLKTANMRQGALYSVNSRSSFPNLNSQMPIDGFSSTRDASSWQRYHLLRVAAYKLGMEERNRKLEVIFPSSQIRNLLLLMNWEHCSVRHSHAHQFVF